MKENKVKPIFKNTIILSLTLLFIYLFFFIVYIIIDGLNDRIERCDTAVVLGNEVLSDSTPSDRLKSRLDESIRLYKVGYFKKIIVSGGIDKFNNDESLAMRNYLVKNLIDKDNIFMDNKGRNTYLTAINTKIIMEKEKFNSIMVISQYYHITRTKMIFNRVGIKNVYNSHAKNFTEIRDIYSIPREVIGYWIYFFTVR